MTRGASLTRGDLPSCDCHTERNRERERRSLFLSPLDHWIWLFSFLRDPLPPPRAPHARNHESPSVAAVYTRRPPIPRRSNHGNGNTSYAYARERPPPLRAPPRDTGDGIINGSVLAGYCFFDGAVTALSADSSSEGEGGGGWVG